MRAMCLHRIAPLRDAPEPLVPAELPDPEPAAGEVLLRVAACGVCHTELDEIEGRVPLRPEVTTYPLADCNRALRELSQGQVRGAKVLVVG